MDFRIYFDEKMCWHENIIYGHNLKDFLEFSQKGSAKYGWTWAGITTKQQNGTLGDNVLLSNHNKKYHKFKT